EKKLKSELENFKSMRNSLDESSQKFEKQKMQRLADVEAGEKFADQIADALDKDEYPVKILGVVYQDRESLRVQLQSILDQLQSAKAAVDSFRELERELLREHQKLILQISDTENQLTTYEVKRALLVAGKTTDETASLVAEMDKLFERNETYIDNNQIIVLEELAKAYADEKATAERDRKIREFLENRRSRKVDGAPAINETVEATPAINETVEVAPAPDVDVSVTTESATPLADEFLRRRAELQESVDDESVDDESVDDEAVDDESVDDESVDDESVDDESVDDESVDDESVDDESVDDESVDDESVDDESVDDESVDDESVDDESVEAESVDDESVEDEAFDDESVEDESVEDESVDDETVDDESVDDESVDDESVDDESVDDEALDDESVDDESVEDESVEDESVEDESVEDESVEDESVEDEAELDSDEDDSGSGIVVKYLNKETRDEK
ncbi:MAG: hypothetical protein ACOX8G_09465, partial [Eubacterium sp.]